MKLLQHRKLSRGITLIEVLVTVVVLAFGLLGLAGLQANSLRNNHSAYLRSQATYLATDIIDRMRANRLEAIGNTVVVNEFYDIDLGVVAPDASGSALTQADVTAWKNNLGILPSGDGVINCDNATAVCTVVVVWAEAAPNEATIGQVSTIR